MIPCKEELDRKIKETFECSWKVGLAKQVYLGACVYLDHEIEEEVCYVGCVPSQDGEWVPHIALAEYIADLHNRQLERQKPK